MLKVKYRESVYVLFIALILLSIQAKAHFFQGIGIMAGLNMNNQRWQIDTLPYNKNQKFTFRPNASLFVEYLNHEYIRVVTEFQYSMEGSKSRLTNKSINLNYAGFNNYLKLRQELYDVTPYFLIGPKAKYLISQSGTADSFRPIHFSMYAAVGIELLYYRPWLILTEIGYDHDINRALNNTFFKATNKTIAVRVGLKYQIEKKAKGCLRGPSIPIQ